MSAKNTRQAAEAMQDIVAALIELNLQADQALPGVRFASVREEKLDRNFRRAIAKGGCYGRFEVKPTRRGFFIRKYIAQITVGSKFESLIDTSDIDGRPVAANTELTAVQVNANEVIAQTDSGVKYRFPIAQVTFQMQQMEDGAHKQQQPLPNTVTPQEVGETRKAQLITHSHYCPHCFEEYECLNDQCQDVGSPLQCEHCEDLQYRKQGREKNSSSDGLKKKISGATRHQYENGGASRRDRFEGKTCSACGEQLDILPEIGKRGVDFQTHTCPNCRNPQAEWEHPVGIGDGRRRKIHYTAQATATLTNPQIGETWAVVKNNRHLLTGKVSKLFRNSAGQILYRIADGNDYQTVEREFLVPPNEIPAFQPVDRSKEKCEYYSSYRGAQANPVTPEEVVEWAWDNWDDLVETFQEMFDAGALEDSHDISEFVCESFLRENKRGTTYGNELLNSVEQLMIERHMVDGYIKDQSSARTAQADDSGALNDYAAPGCKGSQSIPEEGTSTPDDYSCPTCKGPGVMLKDRGATVDFRCRDCFGEYTRAKV